MEKLHSGALFFPGAQIVDAKCTFGFVMINFLKDRATLFAILADAYAIIGVLILNWDPFRIIGLYWLDNCVSMLFLFILFGIVDRSKNHILSAISLVFALLFASGILFIYLQTILNFPKEFSPRARPLSMERLFYPYFDISLFIILTAAAHVHRLKKLLPLDKKEVLPYSIMSFIVGLVIIPAIFILSGYMDYLFHNMKFSMILSLIIFRNLIEYWRYRNLNQVLARTALGIKKQGKWFSSTRPLP